MTAAGNLQRADVAHSSDDAVSLGLRLERLAATESVAANENDESAQVADYESKLQVPVVDLSGWTDLADGDARVRLRIVKEITQACETWGMFQLVNHGIPQNFVDELNKQARDFFSLPSEVKERVNLELGQHTEQQGYLRKLQPEPLHNSWRENLAYASPWSQTKSMINNVWPNGNAGFVECLQEYLRTVDELGLNLLGILAEGLGLESTLFSEQLRSGFDEKRFYWRVNFYPPHPGTQPVLGLTAHTDPNLLSLVAQDEVSGLQAKKGDQWVDVSPIPGALVVNVGDSLEAWTNGRLKSVVHRVQVNNTQQRISWIYLTTPPLVVQAPSQLIDDEHPQRFKPFTYDELWKNLREKVAAARRSQDPQKMLPKKIFYDYALLRP